MNWGLQRASEIQRFQYQLGFTQVPVYCVALTRMFCLGVAGPLVFTWAARATTAERGVDTQAAQQRAAADEARMTLSDLRSAVANGTALRS